MKERDIKDLKVDLVIAHFYHYAMVTLAVVSSSAAASSLPLAILNVLPQWADITLAGGRLLVAPGSIHEIPVTGKWEAKLAAKNLESTATPE